MSEDDHSLSVADPSLLLDPEEDPSVDVGRPDFAVVGIGTSAGGLSALQRFFEQLPARSGMAFVIVLHLSPKHDSNAASILQRSTRMPVRQITETTPLEVDHVYVIPPSKHLSMDDGQLRLVDAERTLGRHFAIDLFFRTLAQVHRDRAFAIVLTGTGPDGAVGLTRIKECGGLTLVQDPDDAEYEGMPRAAIATGNVDFVMPVVEMAQRTDGARRQRQQDQVARR